MAKTMQRPKGYQDRVQTARRLKKESVDNDVTYFSYLVELERTPRAWQCRKRESFRHVIEGESLGPWSRYRRFRAAWTGGMARKDIQLFGVEATCRLMGFSEGVRQDAIEAVRGYCAKRKGRPTYQWIDKRLSEVLTGKSLYQKRKDRLALNLETLERHVGKLENLLRKHRISVPLRPELL